MTRWIPSLARPGPHSITQGGIRLKRQSLLFLTALLLLAALTACASGGEPEPAELSAADGGAFTDIAGHLMEFRIQEGLERGLYGVPVDDGRFRPDDPATRSEFVRALWNLSGQPGKTSAQWAAQEGYPYDAPDEPITRQEAMSILYAHNGSASGIEAMLTGIYDDGFLDSGQIPAEAKPAMYWGFYNVLIRETESGLIAPSGTVSRGDMADILIRYADTFRAESPEN